MTHRIPLSGKRGAGLYALADDQDAERLAGYSWHVTGKPPLLYARAYVRGSLASGKLRTVLMHTLVSGLHAPDHANGDSLDNRRGNLRAASRAQQNRNTAKRAAASSRFKGVWAYGGQGRLRACIRIDRRQVHLGCFDTEEEAARAYDRAAAEAWGAFARLNFPGQ